MQFTASIIKGSGRGNRIGTPTMNLNLEQVPKELEPGIYACRCQLKPESWELKAVLHYGPRPVFKDTSSCEVHFLDIAPTATLDSLTVEIIQKLREVQDFSSVEELQKQIQRDIAEARAILKTC
ncbi:riboflavin kinase [Candidatus Peregrinibacteria bacterium]|nr:riboflavin kinase [Candidatus Peregrinibacteria bacterium]